MSVLLKNCNCNIELLYVLFISIELYCMSYLFQLSCTVYLIYVHIALQFC